MLNSFTKEQLLWLSENIKGILREPNEDIFVHRLVDFSSEIEQNIMENIQCNTIALEHSIMVSEYNSEFEALAEYIDSVKYELDKPVKHYGEWYVTVKNSDNLYLRKDLTIQDGIFTKYEDELNNGYWKTEKEALKSIKKYYSKAKNV